MYKIITYFCDIYICHSALGRTKEVIDSSDNYGFLSWMIWMYLYIILNSVWHVLFHIINFLCIIDIGIAEIYIYIFFFHNITSK